MNGTVVGQDKVGIIAAVCTLLAENNVNILDISTILQGSFTMVMAVDVGGRPVLHRGAAAGRKMGISIRIQGHL